MKLNIGGQKGLDKFPKGWKIIDIRSGSDFIVDLNKDGLPFKDESVKAIYTSHTLEHIFPDRTEDVFCEFYRVLIKNGKIRVVVPNIDLAIDSYINSSKYLKDKRNPRKMEVLPFFDIYYLSSWFFSYRKEGKNRIFDGHLNVFTKESLQYYLRKSGFNSIVFKKYNKCSSVFKGCDFERYRKCSLYAEAVR